jgi:hypothetical protein
LWADASFASNRERLHIEARNLHYKQKIMGDSSFQQSAKKPTTTPSLPLIVKIAIAMTFLNTLVIFFVWPGLLLRVCF